MKLTKNRKIALEKIEKGKAYTIDEAAKLVKEITTTKFDASVDMDIRLGVDPKKANQMVRGVVTLPHGTGKQVRVLVLCTPDKEKEAQAIAIQIKKSPFNAKSIFRGFGIMYFFMHNRHIDKSLTNCEIVIFLTIFRQIVRCLTIL